MKIKQIILLSSVLAMVACASNTTSSSTSSTAHQHGYAHSHALFMLTLRTAML